MNYLMKKLTAGILCAAMITLSACSGNNEDNNNKGSEKGRYLETEYALPEDVSYVLGIGKMADGTIRMVTGEGIFDSADGGKTWGPSPLEYTLLAEREGGYLSNAAVDSNGRLFLAYSNGCYLVDENGIEKEVAVELEEMSHSGMTANEDADESAETASDEATTESANDDIENMLNQVKFTDDGKVVGTDFNGKAYLVDPESSETKTFGDDDTYIEDFAVVGNQLVTLGYMGVDIYNIETGSLEEPDSTLSEYFNEGNSNDSLSVSGRSIVKAEEEDTIYYADATGLYRYTLGAGEMEQLINGSLCSLANPSLNVIGLLEMENNTFLMMYQGHNPSLMYYEFSEEASAVPSEEIKVYALKDNQTIRQAISNFQAQNPDYYVSLEVGMSGDDSVTVSDALSTLNTNIIAGTGPDVILMDKLPIDSYIEKGLLEDLSDVVSESQKESSFYENILNYKQNDDGLYAIPTRFALPFISGTAESLQKVTDLSTLKDEVSRLRSENADIDSIIGQLSAASVINLLLDTSLPEMVKEDETLDRDALTEFLEAAKEIYKANYQPKGDEEEIVMQGINSNIVNNFMEVLGQKLKLNMGNVEGFWDLKAMVGMNDKTDWDFQSLSGLSKQVFVPQDTVGISAKSENKETAKEFIKYLLSEENQSNTQATGFPVNADALDQIYDTQKKQNESESIVMPTETDGGEMEEVTLELRSPSDEEFNTLKEYIEAADTAAVSDAVITEAIAQEGGTCLTEDTDISACVDKILQSVNLHLAE